MRSKTVTADIVCLRKWMRFEAGDWQSRSLDRIGYLSVRKTSGGFAPCTVK
jgi:hypothetical protein